MTELHNLRKLYFEEGKSITEIAKETGRDRKTVRVYLEKEDWNDVRHGSMTEVEFPKLDPFKADIDTWLTEDKKAKRKQDIRPGGFMTGWLRNIRETLPALTAP